MWQFMRLLYRTQCVWNSEAQEVEVDARRNSGQGCWRWCDWRVGMLAAAANLHRTMMNVRIVVAVPQQKYYTHIFVRVSIARAFHGQRLREDILFIEDHHRWWKVVVYVWITKSPQHVHRGKGPGANCVRIGNIFGIQKGSWICVLREGRICEIQYNCIIQGRCWIKNEWIPFYVELCYSDGWR